MKRTVSVVMAMCLLAVTGHGLGASVVTETASVHQYYTQSQSLDGNFSLDYRADIDTLFVEGPSGGWDCTNTNTSTWGPHVTVEATGDGYCDFYSFSGQAGQFAIIDVDHTSAPSGTLDPEITVWFSGYGTYGGEFVAANDNIGSTNLPLDTGGTYWNDPLLQVELPETGVYYIGISDSAAVAYSWTPSYFTRVGVTDGGAYTMHVSLIPEPATLSVLGLGLAALATGRRRRR
jgi:hypothetical protein